MRNFFLILSCIIIVYGAAPFSLAQVKNSGDYEDIMAQYCYDCHGDGMSKGGIRLDELSSLPIKSKTDILNKMQEQLFFKMMPPPDEEHLPNQEDRKQLMNWVAGELKKHNASTFEAKLKLPSYGNVVNHEKLFDGNHVGAAYTPSRRWVISPEIFRHKVYDMFELSEEQRNPDHIKLYGITDPVPLVRNSGVNYYDFAPINEGSYIKMSSNADWISKKQIRRALEKKGELKKNVFKNQKDKWVPSKTAAEFEAIITSDNSPSVELIGKAIEKQFALASLRPPSNNKKEAYLNFTRNAISSLGNTEGLRQMLKAVLLETEFLYRYEIGAGEKDKHGRQKLSPREASYAIAYAIGDRGPDEILQKAAESGMLTTPADYRREATRLLKDENYNRGRVDPGLRCKVFSSRHYHSDIVHHPKIVRFFREFFGYPLAINVFKDQVRSPGKRYHANDRWGEGTAGWLVYEADQFVTFHVDNDKEVFEKLLGSDQFFINYVMDEETATKTLTIWRGIWDKFKNTNWEKNPAKAYEKAAEFLVEENKKIRGLIDKQGRQVRPLPDFQHLNPEDINKSPAAYFYVMMKFFEESFGQGKTPVPYFPLGHGGKPFFYLDHYNVKRVVGAGRYIKAYKAIHGKNPTGKKLQLSKYFFDYPVKQPVSLAKRKGILTHPAWLIAHSLNTHNDAVKRGQWIREKLLAGKIPPIPISVEAQVPENHYKTYRTRLEEVTKSADCMKCHVQMNPLGLTFESYDDFGVFRTKERLEHPENLIKTYTRYDKEIYDDYKTLPIDATGYLKGTGDPGLDGKVDDAIDLIERLVKSRKVRQSIIRHAFRFYMGRNETLLDSKTLIDAEEAYVESGGSFKAVIISLVSSDSFMYRKVIPAQQN